MEAKTISKNTPPDTYEEWLEDYKKNVIGPLENETYFRTAKKMKERQIRRRAIIKECSRMREYYGISQPKIDHVEITCHIEL